MTGREFNTLQFINEFIYFVVNHFEPTDILSYRSRFSRGHLFGWKVTGGCPIVLLLKRPTMLTRAMLTRSFMWIMKTSSATLCLSPSLSVCLSSFFLSLSLSLYIYMSFSNHGAICIKLDLVESEKFSAWRKYTQNYHSRVITKERVTVNA